MAATFIFLLFLVLSAVYIAEGQQRLSNITQGSSLKPTANTSWLSPSGLYAFGFHQQSNGYAIGIFIAGIPERTVVWTANRDNPPLPSNSTLLFTSEGKLIVQQTQGQDIDVISAALSASFASMLDSGNFVLYDSDGVIIWQSFENPTETLLPGQRLRPPQTLFSSISENDHSTGIFRLKMQNDGNLVQYPVETEDTSTNSYWAANNGGIGNNVTLNLDPDGHLYLLNSSSILTNLTGGGFPREATIYVLKIDVDGIFRLRRYDLNQTAKRWVIWSSSTNKCDPKGLCGFNAYCVRMDEEARCICLPGYDFVNPRVWSLGCERNYTAGSCKEEVDGRGMRYTMAILDNTVWEDNRYSISEITTQENCSAACLEDCNCEAALFIDRTCRKQRLPVRYGKRSDTESNVAFVKTGRPEPAVNGDEPARPSGQIIKKELRVDLVIISVSLVAFALVVLLFSGVLVYRNHVGAYKKLSTNGNAELMEDVAPRAFSYAELQRVTNGFKEEVGRGSFGIVYKGTLENTGKAVAVKKLNKVSAEGEREFQTEMKVIGKTHHRNLVRLLGYCHDGPERLLVFEYMTNGSLADVLFGAETENKPKPCWDERFGMALDVARGILYLHEECETQIIHCDIKPQNILMNEYMCAKISDFGLAKLLKHDQTRTFTGIRGTKGYVAPEWHKKLPVTVKADVYSFGIVLLEIICCRRSVDFSLSDDEAVLEEWVQQCFEAGEIWKLVGNEEIDKKKLDRMVKIGIWCIQDEPSLRPSMKKVLLMLEGTVDIPIPPNPTSFLSAI